MSMELNPNVNTGPGTLEVLGYGFVNYKKEEELENDKEFEIKFQRGISTPLIQNLIELCKKDIHEKDSGKSIIPLEKYTIYINFFNTNKDNIISIIIFMDKKDSDLNYSKLYLLTKRIEKKIKGKEPLDSIQQYINKQISIPRSKNIKGIFILNSTGNHYFSKISKNYDKMSELDVHISGFISALFSFSKEIIGKESEGTRLKEINFGDQRFYMVNKEGIIFAYLVDKINSISERYMYLIAEEFIEEFRDKIKNYDGCVSDFEIFEDRINQYLIM